jgi:hypothetical protein
LDNDKSLSTDENPFAENHDIRGGDGSEDEPVQYGEDIIGGRKRRHRGGNAPHLKLRDYLQSIVGGVDEQTAAVEAAPGSAYTTVNLQNGTQLGGKHRRRSSKRNFFGFGGKRKSHKRGG